jgi:short-subunit dehydrogenase
MEPGHVVEYSLRCLERGKLICIPGWRNRLMVRTARWSIRPILRWTLRNFRTNQVMMKGD